MIRPDRTGSGDTDGRSREEVGYFAQLLADKLGDQKSLSYYKLLCARYDPHQLLQKAAEIMGDGGARKPGAVFAAWIKSRGHGHGATATTAPRGAHEPYSNTEPPRSSAAPSAMPNTMPNPALPGSSIGTTPTHRVRAGMT